MGRTLWLPRNTDNELSVPPSNAAARYASGHGLTYDLPT